MTEEREMLLALIEIVESLWCDRSDGCWQQCWGRVHQLKEQWENEDEK